MRFSLLFSFFVLIIQPLISQVNDDFNDGDFTNAPTWSGSVADYTVVANQLRSNSTIASSSFYLSTASTLVNNCQWEFSCNLQFNTSSANYVDIYLISDVANLQSSSINGYFVRLGGTSDEISLYKRVGTTSTKIIDGTDGVLNASNNTLKIKITRSSGNVWDLERDITGTGNSYSSEGNVTDATILASSYFGILVQQSTATFFQKHFFDNVYVGPIILDVTAPTVVSATAITANQLDVLFNETVELTSSQTISNYSVDNSIGVPTSATRDGSNFKLVHLTFSSTFTSIGYIVTVNNVQDNSGNAISNGTTNFTYATFGTPIFKDIVINEIFADPSPIIALPSVEYVELYNRSTTAFNLSGLKFTDNSSTATLPNYTLLPNAYVVLCNIADTAQFTGIGVSNKLGLNGFPSLSNSGDNIYLKDASNNFIDSVRYKDTWYNDASKKDGGWSLELINPNGNSSCAPMQNWKASVSPGGGTPGFVNSVLSTAPDMTAPTISQITVNDSVHVTICFDDVIASSQLSILSNYAINNGIGIPSAITIINDGFCAKLTLTNKLINSTNYTITLTGLTDCNSNALSPNTGIASFYRHKAYDVVINELMPDPDPAIGLPNAEYVELKNRTAFSINLKNWTIGTSTYAKKLPDVAILPDSFIVLTNVGNASLFSALGITAYEVVSMPSLGNTGATLTLRDSNGVVMSSINYTSDWYHDGNKSDGGYSIEQIDPNNPCGDLTNWRASVHPSGGTPGKKNSVYAANPDNGLPQLARINVYAPDTIVLIFNEPMDSVSLISLSNYTIDQGIGQPTKVIPLAADFKKVKLCLPQSIQVGILYTCVVAGQAKDCVGNTIATNSSAPFALPEPANGGDVLINEVLFDPKTNGYDFVELYNNSVKTIDLKALRIGSMDTLTNILIDTKQITTEGYLLFPGGYVVLSENDIVVKQHYSTTNPNGFLNMDDLPSMNTDEDVVTVSDGLGNVIDNFSYTEKMHFPLLVDNKGVSLERIDFNRPTNDKTNWNSAAQNVGFATPAYRNSQYLTAQASTDVKVSNEVFSPDNDGYNDVLNITYSFKEPGKVANVFIYDSKGRQVKHLVRNEQLSQTGVISWNGINEQNEKAPIGIYIIYVEVFTTSGTTDKYKLTCVVASKL